MSAVAVSYPVPGRARWCRRKERVRWPSPSASPSTRRRPACTATRPSSTWPSGASSSRTWTCPRTRRGLREMVLMTGQYGVPVIRVGEKAMVGWNVSRVQAAARTAERRPPERAPRYGPPGHVAELRVRVDEAEPAAVGGAVAVLGDDDLRLALPLRVLVVAVDEHDDVGVLLDGARLAQVRQHRPLVLRAARRRARAATARAPGRSSSLARILRPRLISAISTWRFSPRRPWRLHELQVVHDDEARRLVAQEAAGLRADLDERRRRRVVHVDVGCFDSDEIAFMRPVQSSGAEVPGAHLVGVDPGLGAQHAHA